MAVFVTLRSDDLVYRLNLDCVAFAVEDVTTSQVTIKMRDGRSFDMETEEAQPLLFVLDARFRHVQREIEEAEADT